MKLNPFESKTPKPSLRDLGHDYLSAEGQVDKIRDDQARESSQRGTMFGTFDAKEREREQKQNQKLIDFFEAQLKLLREQGVTDQVLRTLEEEQIDYM